MRVNSSLYLCVAAIVCTWIPHTAWSQSLRWQESSTGCDASLRGLSVVDDHTLWASGANATVLRSVDGGKTWNSCGPSGFEKLEIRSIVAVNDRIATVASAGTPAVILQTQDAGQTWKEVFRHASPVAFFDAMRFWDPQHGMVFSDPVDGRILIVITTDGGQTWQVIPPERIPLATEKEGGFAASNSALCVGKEGRAWIGTGGAESPTSRVYSTSDYGKSWSVNACPLNSDTAAGVFSIAVHQQLSLLIAVGGDYRPEATSATTAAFSRDLGQSWQLASQPPAVFVSAVAVAKSKLLIATGPTSSYYSNDGDHWKQFSATGFHATEASPTGKVYAVGANGRFGVLDLLE
jgi:photosystem II stability/assembly factor-like uncharacterized protein